jgi:hypothetical protein
MMRMTNHVLIMRTQNQAQIVARDAANPSKGVLLGLVGAEAGFDDEGEGGFEGEAGGHERLDPEAMEFFGLVLGLGEEVVEGFEFPAALEVFAIEAFAEFFDERFGFFVDRFVAHLVMPFIY